MHLVLHRSEKALAGLGRGILVDAGGVDLQHLAPEHLLRGADVANLAEQVFKVAVIRATLEAFVIDGEAFDQILGKPGGGPLPELRTARGANAVADGQDGVQTVVSKLPANLPFSLLANL